MKKKYFALPYLVWMIIFTVVPLILVIYYAITKTGQSGNLILTTEYLQTAFSAENMSVLGRSLWYAVITTVVCLVLAYPAAMLLSKLKRSTAGIISMLYVLPMWMNFLLRTYAWKALLDLNGPINSFLGLFGLEPIQFLYTQGAIIFGLVYNFLPFMLLPIYSVFQKMDLSFEQAAEDLGANKIQVFTRVTLPHTPRYNNGHNYGVHAGCLHVYNLAPSGRLKLSDVRRYIGESVHAAERLEHGKCAGDSHDGTTGAEHGDNAKIR